MLKKIMMLATATALAALAVPALASAAPEVTYPAGTTLATGTGITGTSNNFVLTTSIGTIKCAKVTFPGELTENTGSSITIVGSGAGTATTCYDEDEPVNVTDLTLTDLKSTMSGSGAATFSVKADLPVVGTCTYVGTGAPFSYVVGAIKISFNKAPLTASPSACGSAKLDADFILERTSGANPVILD